MLCFRHIVLGFACYVEQLRNMWLRLVGRGSKRQDCVCDRMTDCECELVVLFRKYWRMKAGQREGYVRELGT